uniref:ORF2 n=1 Tax=Loa loa TaxID=7209 RepID=A0A1I7VP25_LOALO
MGGGRRRRIERSSSSIDRRYKRPRNSSERHRRNESRNRRARRRSWNKKNSDHFAYDLAVICRNHPAKACIISPQPPALLINILKCRTDKLL